MKKLLILSLLVCSFVARSEVKSRTVARVLGVEGNAFNFMASKRAKQLIYGSKIEDASVVMVEDGATISLKDETGRVYHLSGGSQVRVFDRLLEVQKGFVWVDSAVGSIGTISSGNSVVKFTQGQFIFNFDNYTSKSQVMVLTGNIQLSNSVEPELLVEVPAGHFSFVDNDIREGMPRGATRVGMTSFKSFQKVFANNERIKHSTFDNAFLSPSLKQKKRSIASVTSVPSTSSKGKIVYIGSKATKRLPASAEPSAMKYYKEAIKVKKKKRVTPKVAIRVFNVDSGVSNVSASAKKKITDNSDNLGEEKSFFNRKSSKRLARIKAKEEAKKKALRDAYLTAQAEKAAKREAMLKKKKASVRLPSSVSGYEQAASAFEQSLRENEVKNMRHSDERNSLIDELKSYNRNYQKQY